MAIIGTLPNNIQNGQAVDANPVMADFNFIVNQVNANANPLGTFTAPSGTTMPFNQASAPLGWTAQTGATYDDAVLHSVIPANFVGASGANSAISFLQSAWNTGGTALSVAQMPAHNHTINDAGHTHGASDSGHTHSIPGENVTGGGFVTMNGASSPTSQNTATGFANISIVTAFTGITVNNNGSGATHNHSNTFNMKMIDFITAVKT